MTKEQLAVLVRTANSPTSTEAEKKAALAKLAQVRTNFNGGRPETRLAPGYETR